MNIIINSTLFFTPPPPPFTLTPLLPGTTLACCVCCYVLAEAFHLPSLSQTCLGQVPGLLTVDSALPLVQFAEGVGSSPLRTICMEYLEMQQIAQQT